MANNRMYLRCPCGKGVMLAKRQATPWWVTADVDEALDAFFEAHADCAKWPNDRFAIDYKVPPEAQ